MMKRKQGLVFINDAVAIFHFIVPNIVMLDSPVFVTIARYHTLHTTFTQYRCHPNVHDSKRDNNYRTN